MAAMVALHQHGQHDHRSEHDQHTALIISRDIIGVKEEAHAITHDQHDHHGNRNGLHGDRALEVLVVHDRGDGRDGRPAPASIIIAVKLSSTTSQRAPPARARSP